MSLNSWSVFSIQITCALVSNVLDNLSGLRLYRPSQEKKCGWSICFLPSEIDIGAACAVIEVSKKSPTSISMAKGNIPLKPWGLSWIGQSSHPIDRRRKYFNHPSQKDLRKLKGKETPYQIVPFVPVGEHLYDSWSSNASISEWIVFGCVLLSRIDVSRMFRDGNDCSLSSISRVGQAFGILWCSCRYSGNKIPLANQRMSVWR